MIAQIPEKLIFNGEETSMTFCPPLPDRHPTIIELDEEDIDTPRRERTGMLKKLPKGNS